MGKNVEFIDFFECRNNHDVKQVTYNFLTSFIKLLWTVP